MVNADIDFSAGTITLRCPRCRRKHVKPVEDTKSPLSIKCNCDRVISWESDLTGFDVMPSHGTPRMDRHSIRLFAVNKSREHTSGLRPSNRAFKSAASSSSRRFNQPFNSLAPHQRKEPLTPKQPSKRAPKRVALEATQDW